MTRTEIRDQKSEVSPRRGVLYSRSWMLAASHRIRRGPGDHNRRGFSLVEMVIVVGIIVLLFALTVGVITVLNRGSESRRTQDALMLIDTAYGEWKRQAERDISYGIDGEPPQATGRITYEIQQDTIPFSPDDNDHEATDELIDIIHRNAAAKALLANINADLLRPASAAHDDIAMIDAWDAEIITVFPGREWFGPNQVPGYPAGDPGLPDEDGTIRTEFENAFGLCVQRRVRFVSAGPDGLFGNLNFGTPTQTEIDAAQDNVYSYPLEAP